MAQTITLGDVSITRAVERAGDIAPAVDVVPGSSPELWEANRSWLAPDFWDPESGLYRAHMQTWVVRSEGMTILVDTGAGNDKDRPYLPFFSRLSTGLLDDLAQAGVRPEDVDYVINTHVHADHVEWNTVLVDRQWVPTFPNAKYLINNTVFQFWNPVNGTDRKAVAFGLPSHLGNQNLFEDSVAPVHQAGQAELWENSYVIDSNLRLERQAGHTPGSAVITLQSGTDSAVFVGDMMHGPVQTSTRTCTPASTRTRALVLPAHFPGSGAARCGARAAGSRSRNGPPSARTIEPGRQVSLRGCRRRSRRPPRTPGRSAFPESVPLWRRPAAPHPQKQEYVHMPRTVVTSSQGPNLPAPLSQAVRKAPRVQLSGKVAFDTAGDIVGKTVTEQTDQIMRNITAVLREGGASLDDVVPMRVTSPTPGTALR